MMLAVQSAEPDARRLAAGLRRMHAQPLHGHGCSCCGGGLVALSAASIEADLLGFLALRYREAGDIAMLDAVERWIEASDSSLLDWISGHSAGSPAACLRDRLMGDLLQIIEQASPPRAAFPPRFTAR